MRAAPALLLAACGYTAGHVGTGGRAELPAAVEVAPFDNATFRRGLEIRLSRDVADEIRARTPRAPQGPERAQWRLRGTIVRAEEQVLSEDLDDEIRESSFVVTVRVVLEDRATEETIGTYSFTEREPFSSRAGRVATLEQAQDEALRDLAEHIVYWLEGRKADT